MDKLLIFIFGLVASLVMIPLVEKRKSEFQRKECYKELESELIDIKSMLCGHIKLCFDCLYSLRTDVKKVEFGMVPIPIPGNIETVFLIELYKKTALILNSDQRQAVKRIPFDIKEIHEACSAVKGEKPYASIKNIESLKKSIELACLSVYDINKFLEHRDRYKVPMRSDYLTQVRNVLLCLGYTSEQIDDTRIDLTDMIFECE